MGITAVLLLSSLGFLASVAHAQNCSRPVGDNMDLKGNDILLTSFPDGITVTFACNTGYESAGGSPRITCTAGSWSPVQLKCQRKNCGPVEDVENGQIEYHPGTEFGDKAVVICNPGHMAVGGGELTCGSQGWMGRFPTCEVTKCDSPPVVQYGSFSPNKDEYEYNEVIQYTCRKDYTLDGSRQLHCSDDGTFKPEPPRCIKVECGEPEIPFGQWSGGARPPYGHMSTVTLKCNTGYKMNGTATVTCALNSQWSPGLPQCILPSVEGCEDPKKKNALVIVNSPPPYRHSDTVTLKCPSGYSLSGLDTQTCKKNGLWSPGIPECTPDNGSGSTNKIIVAVVVPVILLTVAVGVGLWVFYKQKSKKTNGNHVRLVAPELLAIKTASENECQRTTR